MHFYCKQNVVVIIYKIGMITQEAIDVTYNLVNSIY